MEIATVKSPKTKNRPKKSVPLTKEEVAAIKDYAMAFPSWVAASMAIGVERMVLERAISYGSTSPRTAMQIRKAIKKLKKTAK